MRTKKSADAIRLQFDLERADNPRLYDELVSFRQGVKRVNRLRTLAHEGLMVLQLQSGWEAKPAEPAAPAPDSDELPKLDAKASSILCQVFEDPIMD
jgi:hypothetical protein